MTDEQIDAMQAGPEIDRAVAAVCFDVYRLTPDVDPLIKTAPCVLDVHKHSLSKQHPLWLIPSREGEHRPFAPSEDWNDAMFAAERFGLFNRAGVSLSRGDWYGEIDIERVVWRITQYESTLISHADSGPLAICSAILKLARDKA